MLAFPFAEDGAGLLQPSSSNGAIEVKIPSACGDKRVAIRCLTEVLLPERTIHYNKWREREFNGSRTLYMPYLRRQWY